MRCESEVHDRISAGETELKTLTDEIAKLSLEVKLGGDRWREAQEALAARMERRRALLVQLDSLHWVLTSDAARLAG
jgi:hypothetical protein